MKPMTLWNYQHDRLSSRGAIVRQLVSVKWTERHVWKYPDSTNHFVNRWWIKLETNAHKWIENKSCHVFYKISRHVYTHTHVDQSE